jgi:hypothetical protein
MDPRGEHARDIDEKGGSKLDVEGRIEKVPDRAVPTEARLNVRSEGSRRAARRTTPANANPADLPPRLDDAVVARV